MSPRTDRERALASEAYALGRVAGLGEASRHIEAKREHYRALDPIGRTLDNAADELRALASSALRDGPPGAVTHLVRELHGRAVCDQPRGPYNATLDPGDVTCGACRALTAALGSETGREAAPSASGCDAREIGEDACTCRRCLMGQVERLRAATVAIWNTAGTNDDTPEGCYFVRSEPMLAAHALTRAPGRNCPAATGPRAHSTDASGTCVYCGARYPNIEWVDEDGT